LAKKQKSSPGWTLTVFVKKEGVGSLFNFIQSESKNFFNAEAFLRRIRHQILLKFEMIYIKSVTVDLSGVNPIEEEFELGDLTIFIGKSNSGKTRILTDIFNRMLGIQNNSDNLKAFTKFRDLCESSGIVLGDINSSFKTVFVPSPRQNINTINALGIQLSKSSHAAKIIDSSIKDLGNHQVKFSNDDVRSLAEQGSGIQNLVQVLNILYAEQKVVIIDEPETSQTPYGKIEILRNVVELCDEKQIIFATHDPTLINQYLIKKIKTGKNFKVVIYSYSADSFKKIDFNSSLDPEIHVGYLSQTYSGKPVHLIVEGQTEFYLFQALLFKFCLANKIRFFPKIINKISLSYLAGNQWHININHLPDVRFFSVVVLLDGEYSEAVKQINASNISTEDDFSYDKINLKTLSATNIEKVLGEEVEKPLGWALKVWNMSDQEILDLEHKNKDAKLIFDIIRWCIEETQYNGTKDREMET